MFPLTFKDRDGKGTVHTFLAQTHTCLSSYVSDPNNPDETKDVCRVDDEFSANNYKSSPDGYFDLTILNNEDRSLDMNSVKKLRIVLETSYIMLNKKSVE